MKYNGLPVLEKLYLPGEFLIYWDSDADYTQNLILEIV